jgi:hypothetical protein
LIAMALAGVGLAHFYVSILFWILIVVPSVRRATVVDWSRLLGPSASAALLFCVFLLALCLAWKGLRISRTLILGGLLAAAASFWYDIGHHRYQMHAWRDDGIHECSYATWWWYAESRTY